MKHDHSKRKRIYIIYRIENGGKPQKIYIRPYYNLIGAKKKMEKFNEIIRDVKQTQQKIQEVEEKAKVLQNTYLTIMDIKERHEKRKTVENELVRLEEKESR